MDYQMGLYDFDRRIADNIGHMNVSWTASKGKHGTHYHAWFPLWINGAELDRMIKDFKFWTNQECSLLGFKPTSFSYDRAPIGTTGGSVGRFIAGAVNNMRR